jgi:hypothetical protein
MGAPTSEQLLGAPISKIPGSTGWNLKSSKMAIPIPNLTLTGGAATSAPSGYNQFGNVYIAKTGGLWTALLFIGVIGAGVYLWQRYK